MSPLPNVTTITLSHLFYLLVIGIDVQIHHFSNTSRVSNYSINVLLYITITENQLPLCDGIWTKLVFDPHQLWVFAAGCTSTFELLLPTNNKPLLRYLYISQSHTYCTTLMEHMTKLGSKKTGLFSSIQFLHQNGFSMFEYSFYCYPSGALSILFGAISYFFYPGRCLQP